ncbi:hypothetical protein CKF54_00305 [Psittacicella hinzii]|uniref:Uncharacterized protein n=1 Tax=Psittacicella hinzii TaxID=2028575 RepID=A0A3A1YAA8_9GAMM|nr:hypothetical protein [Psittacicella hinzii]RIY34471.1 hypothetical protein CKF54_00305 [Psittacicella hinzii]
MKINSENFEKFIEALNNMRALVTVRGRIYIPSNYLKYAHAFDETVGTDFVIDTVKASSYWLTMCRNFIVASYNDSLLPYYEKLFDIIKELNKLDSAEDRYKLFSQIERGNRQAFIIYSECDQLFYHFKRFLLHDFEGRIKSGTGLRIKLVDRDLCDIGRNFNKIYYINFVMPLDGKKVIQSANPA